MYRTLENDPELESKYIDKLIEHAIEELTRVEGKFNRMRIQEELERREQRQKQQSF
jgi:hypothetical protein